MAALESTVDMYDLRMSEEVRPLYEKVKAFIAEEVQPMSEKFFELGATRVDDPPRGLDPLPSPGDARSVCRDDQSRATGVTPTARLRTRVEMTPPTAPQGRSSR